MPELPEVETVAQDLRQSGIIGKKIIHFNIFWTNIFTSTDLPKAISQLVNRKITSINRRAKYLLIGLSGGLTLLIHLRMTGKLLIKPAGSPHLPHEHIVLILDDHSQIHYHDTRKFGRWELVEDAEKALSNLGPEPLSPSFTKTHFSKLLKPSKRMLKPLLLDQSFIAGLGNIYVDEALWEAYLHPCTLANTLSQKQAYALFEGIQRVLKRGLETKGTTLGYGRTNFYRPDGTHGTHQNALNVFRRTGLPCPRCGQTIVKLIVSQRSTHICPKCQLRPF